MTEVVVAHLARDGAGRPALVPDLDTATSAAAHTGRLGVRMMVRRRLEGTVRDWCALLLAQRADTLVLVHERDARGLARLVSRQIPGDVIACEQRELPTTLRAMDPYPADGPVSPYQRGVLSTGHAAVAGVGLEDPATVLADVDLIVREAVEPRSVPVRTGRGGAGAWAADGELVTGLAERADRLRRARVEVVPVVHLEDVTPTVLAGCAAAVVDEILVVASAAPGADERLRRTLVLARAAGIACRAYVDLADVADEMSPELGSLIQVMPDLEIVESGEPLRAHARRGALAGTLPHASAGQAVRDAHARRRGSVERAATGHYAPIPLAHGVHDLWWHHPDPVEEHASWVGDVVASGGSVLVSGRPDAPPTVAGAEVVDERAECPVAGWAEPLRDEARVLVIGSQTDRDALLDLVEDAWTQHDLPPLLGDPTRQMGATCRLGIGPCPSRRAHSLLVDEEARVRTGDGGPVVGRLGDSFAGLRRRARRLADRHGCSCLPEAWSPTAAPAYLGRVLDAAAATRAWSTPEGTPGVSGLGEAIYHGGAPADAWPGRLVLVRRGDECLAWSGETGAHAQLDAARAAVVELHLDRGPEAVGLLARTGARPGAAKTLVEQAASLVARLTGPAEEQRAPSASEGAS